MANETWKFVQAKSKQAMKQVLGIRDEKARMKVTPPLAVAPITQDDDMRWHTLRTMPPSADLQRKTFKSQMTMHHYRITLLSHRALATYKKSSSSVRNCAHKHLLSFAFP